MPPSGSIKNDIVVALKANWCIPLNVQCGDNMIKRRCDVTVFSLALFLCVQFDSNGDGQISLTELREAMKKLMGEQVTNREINEILRDVDLNGDGLVDFEGKRSCLLFFFFQEITFILILLSFLSCLFRVRANDVSLTFPAAHMSDGRTHIMQLLDYTLHCSEHYSSALKSTYLKLYFYIK